MKFLADLFPVILFFVAYKMFDIYAATMVAIAASFGQTLFHWLRHRRLEKMHLITLGLLVVFGGLTLALRDPQFIKWKPTIVNWLFGVVFLGSQLFGERTVIERMMGHAITLPKGVWSRLNIGWGIFFLAMGGLNLYVAYNYSEEIWVDFKLFGMMGLTILFVVAQSFYLTRHIQEPETIGEGS